MVRGTVTYVVLMSLVILLALVTVGIMVGLTPAGADFYASIAQRFGWTPDVAVSPVRPAPVDNGRPTPRMKHPELGTARYPAECTLTLTPEPGLPPNLRQAAQSAARILADTTDFRVRITRSGGAPIRLTIPRKDPDVKGALGVAYPGWANYASNGSIKPLGILVNQRHSKDLDDSQLTATMLHEMGHLLGLGHSRNPTSIVYPQLSNVSAPSQHDLRALRQAAKDAGCRASQR